MKHILTLAVAALTLTANAGYYNLADPPYNLSEKDWATKVSDRYAPGADTLALPYAWAALKGGGW